MKKNNQDNNFRRSIHSYEELLNEYYELSCLPLLSELEAKRLEHILEMACQDEKLSLLLHEIDEFVFQEQNLCKRKCTDKYQNQIARVLELIDSEIPSYKIVFEHAKLNLSVYEKTISEYCRFLKLSSLSEADEAQMEQILEESYNDELLSLLIDIVNEKFFEKSNTTTPKKQDLRQTLIANNFTEFLQIDSLSGLSEQHRVSKIKAIGSKIRNRRSSLLVHRVGAGVIACSLMLSSSCFVKLIYEACMLPLPKQISKSKNYEMKSFKSEVDLDSVEPPPIDFVNPKSFSDTKTSDETKNLEPMNFEALGNSIYSEIMNDMDLMSSNIDLSMDQIHTHNNLVNQDFDDFLVGEEFNVEDDDEKMQTLIVDVDLEISFNSLMSDELPIFDTHIGINRNHIETAFIPFSTQGYFEDDITESSNRIPISEISGSSNNSGAIVNQLSQLATNTVTSGNGGNVIIRSGEGLHFSSLLAHGGANRGNGGVIEVDDNLTAKVGSQGTILLAPFNIVIRSVMETDPDEIGQLDYLLNSSDILISGVHGNISIDTQKNSAPIPVEVVSAESISPRAIEQINNYGQGSLQLAQSVSELSDVQPSDWAFTALQRLVEEHGCIEGFPNRTYRGNQTMTRYEFAAGLNACLDVIVQLIDTSITAEELATIRRLQEEFQSELATLRGRLNALEDDVAELEANQFSTTTKLRGQVDAHVNVPFDNAFDGEETTFEYRARLNFDTSFTGEDRLRLRLQSGTNDEAPVGFPGGFANSASGDNDVSLDDVYYSFPLGDRLDIIIAGNSIATDDFVTSVIVPFAEYAVGEAAEEPLFYDFEMDGDAGAGFSYAFTDNLILDAGYSVEADAAGDPVGQGLFSGGGQSYIAQISYLSDGLLDAGFAFLRGNPDPGDESTNTFAGLLNIDLGRFEVGGYGAFHDQDSTDEEPFSWVAGLTVPDFFAEGNTLGAYVGQAPEFDGDEPFYAEGFYDIEVNEFLTITPVVLWAEENSFETTDVESSSVYGVLRATFRF